MVLNLCSCDGSQQLMPLKHLMKLEDTLTMIAIHATEAVVSHDGCMRSHAHLCFDARQERLVPKIDDTCVHVAHDVIVDPSLVFLCYAHSRCMCASMTNDAWLFLGVTK